MKQFDISNFTTQTTDQANLFDVYSAADGTYYYNMLKNVNFVNQTNVAPSYYTLYQVIQGDTWTNISYKFYKDYRLWWLVCKFNSISDPTTFPVVGTYLKIPTEAVKTSVLNQIKTS